MKTQHDCVYILIYGYSCVCVCVYTQQDLLLNEYFSVKLNQFLAFLLSEFVRMMSR